jgi:Phosphotransferase enzyme family
MNVTTDSSQETQDLSRSESVSRADKIASRTNENLMRRLQKALDADPGIDLLAFFPQNYAERVRRQEKAIAADNAVVNLNRRTLEGLQNRFTRDPEFNLPSAVPYDYEPLFSNFKNPTALLSNGDQAEPPISPDLRNCLKHEDTVSILSPISQILWKLLFKSSSEVASFSGFSPDLTSSLISLLWAGEVLYDFTSRMVLKCSDEVVAKILGRQQTNEYSTLRYLEEKLPGFPAPRPYGLVCIGNHLVLFMSYVPGTTLRAAWPELTDDNKISIQNRLQELFSRLRTLRQDDGLPLGGVGGEGVKDDRISSGETDRPILSATEFVDFQFSNSKFGSRSYVQFLRAFLPDPKTGSIFTHGDVRTANIMVDKDENHSWTVTGIIDWEESGFYPDFFESTKLTRTMNVVDEDDWYLYIPNCIAPAQFPLRWLVDRVWDKHPQWT